MTLGGGGARGLAHLGVLEALEGHGIPVVAVAGASMGGLLGALYCGGVPLDEVRRDVERLVQPRELLRFVDLGRGPSGVSVKGARIYEFLTERLGGEVRFESLRIPLAVVAVDVRSGRRVVLDSGSVPEAVRATISIPGVFEPVQRDGMQLVDGGVLDNLPVDVGRTLSAAPVVAVDPMPYYRDREPGLHRGSEPPDIPGIPRVVEEVGRVVSIMVAEMTALRLEPSPPDLLLRPELPSDVTIMFGFGRATEVIEAGRRAAEAALPRIRELVEA